MQRHFRIGTAIFALIVGIADGTNEFCEEGDSSCASGASAAGRSVLQTRQISRHVVESGAECQGYCKKNAKPWEGKCGWDACGGCAECEALKAAPAPAPKVCETESCKDPKKGWDTKCNFRGKCDGCSQCDSVQKKYEAKWATAVNDKWEENCKAGSSPKGKPNILVVMADDMNADGGGPGAKMPNLDKLASTGVKFTRAYADHPICAPSRSATMTGVVGSASKYNMGRMGLTKNAMEKKVAWYENEILKDGMTFMEFFRSKCYVVFGSGKLNHDELYDSATGPWPAEGQWDYYYAKSDYGPVAFDGSKNGPHPSMPEGMNEEFDHSSIDFNWGKMSDVPFGGKDGKGWKYRDQKYPVPSGMFKYNSPTDRDLLPDEFNAEWAMKTLDKLEKHNVETGQPFVLMVGLVRPHAPLYAPDEYFDMFPLDEVVMPEDLMRDFPATHYDEASVSVGTTVHGWVDDQGKAGAKKTTGVLGFRLYYRLATEFATPEEGFKKWFQAYYACMAFVDAQVGKVVDHLETKPKLYENTIIAFWADNGWNNGPKQYIYKNAPWEEGARVPLIIRAPGMQTEGLVTDALVTLVDLYPTFMELCGFNPKTENTIKGPNGVPISGVSLKSVLSGGAGKEVAVSQIYPTANKVVLPWPECNENPTCNHWSVRDLTHRYILYNDGHEELYNYEADPKERTNIAAEPSSEGVKEALKSKLKTMPNMADFWDDLGTWTADLVGKVRAPEECCKTWCTKANTNWVKQCKVLGCSLCWQCGGAATTCSSPLDASHVVPTQENCAATKKAIDDDLDPDNEWQYGAEAIAALKDDEAWYNENCA